MLAILEKGERKDLNLNFRHFLSLLFGYCGLLSLALFLVSVLAQFLASSDLGLPFLMQCILEVVFLSAYFYFFFQLIFSTFLGIYFLSDKLHRL